VRRTSMQLAAVVLAGGLAVAACGNSLQLGAVATSDQGRITSVMLTNEIANLKSAYKTDAHKGLNPQRPVAQAPQQVLTWLLTFQVFDKLAALHDIHISPAQVQKQLVGLQAQASQQKASTAAYVSAAGAVPPDLLHQIGRYFAILQAFENTIDGGKQPSDQAGQQALQARVAHAQCLAAKNINIRVNPQYGAFDYGTFSVVTVPSKLAGSSSGPSPSPSTSPTPKPRLTPPC